MAAQSAKTARAMSVPIRRPRLITMPHSHYCEKARWALDYCRVDYVEEPHLMLLHRLHTRRAGGGPVPILLTSSDAYLSSAAIAMYAHRQNLSAKLLPATSSERASALALQKEFDEELGAHARQWAYFMILNQFGPLQRMASAGTPWYERLAAPAAVFISRPLIRRAYRVNAVSAAESLQRVRAIFGRVERLLTGAAFLAGDSFSIADLTFAALAAPLLRAGEYGEKVLPDALLPLAMIQERDRLRASKAGVHALRSYDEYRYRV